MGNKGHYVKVECMPRVEATTSLSWVSARTTQHHDMSTQHFNMYWTKYHRHYQQWYLSELFPVQFGPASKCRGYPMSIIVTQSLSCLGILKQVDKVIWQKAASPTCHPWWLWNGFVQSWAPPNTWFLGPIRVGPQRHWVLCHLFSSYLRFINVYKCPTKHSNAVEIKSYLKVHCEPVS